jgi:hypothetical protein
LLLGYAAVPRSIQAFDIPGPTKETRALDSY